MRRCPLVHQLMREQVQLVASGEEWLVRRRIYPSPLKVTLGQVRAKAINIGHARRLRSAGGVPSLRQTPMHRLSVTSNKGSNDFTERFKFIPCKNCHKRILLQFFSFVNLARELPETYTHKPTLTLTPHGTRITTKKLH